ncbi:MAG: hypothetical protein ACP5OG_05540 [Candidatus Nanoarchaeia archaeon]
MANKLTQIALAGALAIASIITGCKSCDKDQLELNDFYKSLDYSKATKEEKDWVNRTNKQEFYNELKSELTQEQYKALDKTCGLKNLSDKDMYFLYKLDEKIGYQIKSLVPYLNQH